MLVPRVADRFGDERLRGFVISRAITFPLQPVIDMARAGAFTVRVLLHALNLLEQEAFHQRRCHQFLVYVEHFDSGVSALNAEGVTGLLGERHLGNTVSLASIAEAAALVFIWLKHGPVPFHCDRSHYDPADGLSQGQTRFQPSGIFVGFIGAPRNVPCLRLSSVFSLLVP